MTSNVTLAVLAAELKMEWRAPSGFAAAALFSVLILVCQSLTIPSRLMSHPEIAFSVFFVSVFFAALLSENARIAREQKTGFSHLLALSTAGPAQMYVGRAAASFCFMCMIELCLAPFLIVFYNLPVSRVLLTPAMLCMLAGLSLCGLTTLFGAATASWRGAGGNAIALPLVILPMALPILATASLGAARVLDGQPVWPYLKLLLAAVLAVWTVGLLTYGKLLGKT